MEVNRESTLLIQAGQASRHYWRDLWRFRELFLLLAWRDILVRYKQTVIGISWAVLRPLLTMLVFTFVFGRLAKLPSEGVPYPLLVFAGLLPWQFFSTALSEAGSSLLSNSAMISKIYFPRVIVPSSAIIVGLVDLLIAGVLFFMLMAWYEIHFTWNLVFLPFFVGIAIAAALGAGLLVSALNVKYRDFRYIVPFVLQLGLYISPVGFSSQVVPEQYRSLYALNPMVGVIEGVRWSTLGTGSVPYVHVVTACTVALVLLVSGFVVFRKTEKTFADII